MMVDVVSVDEALQNLKDNLNKLFGSLPINFHLSKGIFEVYNLGTKPEWETWLNKFQKLRTDVLGLMLGESVQSWASSSSTLDHLWLQAETPVFHPPEKSKEK